MSFFKSIDTEQMECIPLKLLIKELAEQESVETSKIIAILLREYTEEIPFHEKFSFYYYDLVYGLVEANSNLCRSTLIKAIYENSLDDFDFSIEIEKPLLDAEKHEICVKAVEMAIFLIDVSVKIPNCLRHVEDNANEWFKRKYPLMTTQKMKS
ncbi:hypothetical protein [Arsenophonus sp.]|uniref:hypothetical protein n=1 Tax=Arsenophonus sp. TaxID=1872640 RepID=UPI003879B9EC